jgi:hypothetical protein
MQIRDVLWYLAIIAATVLVGGGAWFLITYYRWRQNHRHDDPGMGGGGDVGQDR